MELDARFLVLGVTALESTVTSKNVFGRHFSGMTHNPVFIFNLEKQ